MSSDLADVHEHPFLARELIDLLDITEDVRLACDLPLPPEWTVEIGSVAAGAIVPEELPDLTDAQREALRHGDLRIETVTLHLLDAERNVVTIAHEGGYLAGRQNGTALLPHRTREVQQRLAAQAWRDAQDQLNDSDLIRSHLAALEIEVHRQQEAADAEALAAGVPAPPISSDPVLISDVCARTIAEQFHAGGTTPGYRFAVTGAIGQDPDELVDDLFRDLPAVNRRLNDQVPRPSRAELFGDRELHELATTMRYYVGFYGPRGPVTGWASMT